MSDFVSITNSYAYDIVFYGSLAVALFIPSLLGRYFGITERSIRGVGWCAFGFFVILTCLRVIYDIRDAPIGFAISVDILQMSFLFYFFGSMWPPLLKRKNLDRPKKKIKGSG